MRVLVAALAFACQPAFAQFNGFGDGLTDNKAAMDAAQSSLCATNRRTITVPCGTYRFLAPPEAPTCAVNLVGEGKACTFLVKDYSGDGGYFLKRGQNETDQYGGGSIRDLSIRAGPASHDGIAIWVVATPDPAGLTATTKNPHGILIDNVMIGADVGGGTFLFGIYLDGSQNNGPGALGLRSVNIRNTSIAAATYNDLILNHAIGTSITSTECFGTPTYVTLVYGGSDGTIIQSRTCAPTIINSINTYKWP